MTLKKRVGGGEATQNEHGVTDKILRPIDLISQHIYTVIIYTMEHHNLNDTFFLPSISHQRKLKIYIGGRGVVGGGYRGWGIGSGWW